MASAKRKVLECPAWHRTLYLCHSMRLQELCKSCEWQRKNPSICGTRREIDLDRRLARRAHRARGQAAVQIIHTRHRAAEAVHDARAVAVVVVAEGQTHAEWFGFA